MISIDEFTAAYQSGYARTVRFVKTKGFTAAAAEDIAQTSWMKAWSRREHFEGRCTIMVWVAKIALNSMRDIWRITAEEVPLFDVHPSLDRHPQRVHAHEVLERISLRHASLLKRRYLRGESIADLAQQDGTTNGGMRLRLLRAKTEARRRAA